MKKGFTLIELLIVVAIIAILAAIAIPNFLEAQVRAKVARSKSDMRTLAVGLESYVVDNTKVPPDGDDYPNNGDRSTPMSTIEMNRPSDLVNPHRFPTSDANNDTGTRIYYFRTYRSWSFITTPVAYLNTVLIEPYSSFIPYGRQDNSSSVTDPQYMIITSVGPDRTILASRLTSVGNGDTTNFNQNQPGVTINDTSIRSMNNIYDPTNGTLSYGEVYRFATIKSTNNIPYGSLVPLNFPN